MSIDWDQLVVAGVQLAVEHFLDERNGRACVAAPVTDAAVSWLDWVHVRHVWSKFGSELKLCVTRH
jgi:hypothetical protein